MSYKEHRWGPVEPSRSKEFISRSKIERNGVSGFVTLYTLDAMFTYMEYLESRVE